MRSGKAGGVAWTIAEDGTLALEGTGSVDVDTSRGPAEGAIRVDGESIGMAVCGGCRQWLPVEDGKIVHDAEQVVRCVLES